MESRDGIEHGKQIFDRSVHSVASTRWVVDITWGTDVGCSGTTLQCCCCASASTCGLSGLVGMSPPASPKVGFSLL